ncbi:MAG: hypothetical protein IPJ88_17790 [Myxococcales bacterium]|nr:MAG: hypothetical protein IPJ88_17790 [Myxococcales bacterium]
MRKFLLGVSLFFFLSACDSDGNDAGTTEGCPEGVERPNDGTPCSPVGLSCYYPSTSLPNCPDLRTDCVAPGQWHHWDGVCIIDGTDGGTDF